MNDKIENIMKTKICPKCEKEKLTKKFFGENKRRIDGYSRLCKECNNKARREEYQRNKEKYIEYRKENREKFLEYAKTYNKENKKKKNKSQKKYYEKNKEKIAKKYKEYRKKKNFVIIQKYLLGNLEYLMDFLQELIMLFVQMKKLLLNP